MTANGTMTPRRRWLAAARMEPVDRLPFWPKLNAAYPPAQAAPFREMTVPAIMDWIGCEKHLGVGVSAMVKAVRRKTTVEQVRENGARRAITRTPSGAIEAVMRYDPASASWHPSQFPVANLEQLRVLIEAEEDVSYDVDLDAVEKCRACAREIGEDAVWVSAAGTSALMEWVQHIAGIENAHYLLMEHPEEVEAFFDAHHRNLLRRVEIFAEHSPADFIYLTENTSTSIISPAQFRRYGKPRLAEYCRILRDAGKIAVLHMCGLLKDLLDDLSEIPAHVFEAFTSPTVGNTTLLDGRARCPDKCLVGGTNATLWTRPAGEIIARIQADLDALPHHRGIVVTSAGVMPPACRPETIREVCDWVHAYPARM